MTEQDLALQRGLAGQFVPSAPFPSASPGTKALALGERMHDKPVISLRLHKSGWDLGLKQEFVAPHSTHPDSNCSSNSFC